MGNKNNNLKHVKHVTLKNSDESFKALAKKVEETSPIGYTSGMWERKVNTSLPCIRIKELIMNDLCKQKVIGYKLKKEYFKYVDVINQLVLYVYGDFNAEDVIDSTMTKTLTILEKSDILDKWFDEVYFKEPKLPIINKYEGKYHKDSHISYGFAELPLEWFMSDKNRSMTSITLNSGAVLSKSDIEQIKEYLIYQNNK